ncbi:N-succinylarginine dihydrolase, partial [Burkholderia cenocepacia]|nr:N-succinylarginine dihydrolase [Burkholderia cenocepacia]
RAVAGGKLVEIGGDVRVLAALLRHDEYLRESMKNGGGPACLRLRVVLNEAERAAVTSNVWINDTLFASLDAWIDKHYRDRLAPEDLADPALL